MMLFGIQDLKDHLETTVKVVLLPYHHQHHEIQYILEPARY